MWLDTWSCSKQTGVQKVNLDEYYVLESMFFYFFVCSASVAAVFILDEEEGKEIRFQRSVLGSSSEYRINNTVSNVKFCHTYNFRACV